jgi:hypothetical protein
VRPRARRRGRPPSFRAGGQAEGALGERQGIDDEDAHRLGNGAVDLRQQVGMDDQQLRLAIDQDVAHLGRLEVPVDRAPTGADPARREHQLEQHRLVAQHHRDDLARGESGAVQRRRGAHASGEEGVAVLRRFVEPDGRLHGDLRGLDDACLAGAQPRCGSISTFSPVARLL